ncbi:MAG: D-glycero-beta-D-manno-heptose-7-phosphate kinase [Verrucomicrobiota bacterium]
MSEKGLDEAVMNDIIEKMKATRIMVVGDLMLDKFVRGEVNRISPEAPIPVVKVTSEDSYPGGAANVARNISLFGARSGICGVIGKDRAGDELIRLLKKDKIQTTGLFVEPQHPTIVKTRVVARQQQVVRVDYEQPLKLLDEDIARLEQYFKRAIPRYDAVIIEDYGKGAINQEIFDMIATLCKENEKIVAVDPNPNNLLGFHDITVIKPNRKEAFEAAQMIDRKEEDQLRQLGEYLLELWSAREILITLSEEGMILFRREQPPYHTPPKAREVYDVSGAGDTAIAFYTMALAAGLKGGDAVEIANHAASVVVGKLGTATVSGEELSESFEQTRYHS